MELRWKEAAIPKRFARLIDLAGNLWWTWQPDAQRLFERLDPVLWEEVRHNPVALLRRIERARLNAAAQSPGYLELYDRVLAEFDRALTGETWFERTFPAHTGIPIAYFSTEFGIHEAFPAYAGGLGVLAGDSLKEASDLGLPMVGVGLLYQHGYFNQRITEDGWQEALYEDLDLENLPLSLMTGPDGQPLQVEVAIAGSPVRARIWRLQIGRIPLYLLDTQLPENAPADRELSAQLYAGDPERRIAQEMILGIGGVRALRALGVHPGVWHLNEGHSAFSILERLREHIAEGLSFEEAAARVRETTVFTTHTPVPAGHDRFSFTLIERAFAGYWEQLRLSFQEFCELGRQDEPWGPTFNMTVLALRFSDHRNAVSELHGRVTRRMWAHLWPDRPAEQVPIRHITNGVHVGTWLARRMRALYQRYLGPDWMERVDDPALWERVLEIPDEELWTIRRHLKRKLVAFMRERARRRWQRNHVSPIQIVASGVLLDPYALTIGFARRFALYKRAYLLFRDPDRLRRLVNDPQRPVQIILAGKAHPADEPAKRMMQEIYRLIKDPAFGGRIAFLEDYDIEVARYLVQGVDVWLNTPRRPLEASGTSGQKAALNGVLNLSVLDGWWREGYNGANGWAIGEDRDYEDPNVQDAADAASLYELLENVVVPLYYDVEADGIPHRWLRMVKESIRSLAPFFNTRRMMKEYLHEMYFPALEAARRTAVAIPEPVRQGVRGHHLAEQPAGPRSAEHDTIAGGGEHGV
ncbi:alpha-glucan family phosphorylase [Thermoflexus sp.]|uniref:alpha-glucan family phosphorylase n=1 Tax=Thermoflexus sp. TaxID=1969742 RepID=UPI0025E997FE|nr:alpha-glucan family phosphorylase [Thermoflexus sp.]MCS6964388.1 alpha-glucan family phosphorylase [Thermoflexus sp.]MDW8185100.1 alpha-glucan family phosphorylase [Anaerolineae bacterium]